MSKNSDAESDTFTIQFRVSRANNPKLYRRLTSDLEAGEKQASVVRHLAEEALLLRDHPITRIFQSIDFKEFFQKQALISFGETNAAESKKQLSENTNKEFSELKIQPETEPERTQKPLVGEPELETLGKPTTSGGMNFAKRLHAAGKGG